MSEDLNFSLDLNGGPQERRKSPRKPLRTAAVLQIGTTQLRARVIDIGQDTVAMSVDQNLPLGTDCVMSFSVRALGRAMRSHRKAGSSMSSLVGLTPSASPLRSSRCSAVKIAVWSIST